jgi:hypothetical protein
MLKTKPAAEWAICLVVPPGKTVGGLHIPNQEGLEKLHLVAASEGHYTAGTLVPCAIPVGSFLIPRPNAEIHDIGVLEPQHVMIHLRDVVGFQPPEND